MGLKEKYTSLEYLWYDVTDNIPGVRNVVGVVDKIVPSFALFLVIILALIVWGLSLFILPGGPVPVVLTFQDSVGSPLIGIQVLYTVNNVEHTVRTDEFGALDLDIPINSTLFVDIAPFSIAHNRYDAVHETISVKQPISRLIVVREQIQRGQQQRTVLFQGTDGRRITDRAIKVLLSCSDPTIVLENSLVSDTDQDGSITFNGEENCDALFGRVIEPSEFQQTSFVLNQTIQEVTLKPNTASFTPNDRRGKLRVTLFDEDTRILDSISMHVTLTDSLGRTLEEQFTEGYGEVVFKNLLPGTYGVIVTDPSENYAIKTRSSVSVLPEQTETVELSLTKSIKGVLAVSVIDAGTRSPVENAVVELRNTALEKMGEQTLAAGDSGTRFSLQDFGQYTLFVHHPDYLFERITVPSIPNSITVELTPLTEENSGRVEVTVTDERGFAVENAIVSLRFADSDAVVPGATSYTDTDGIAAIQGVRPGIYYVSAEKYPAYADNKDNPQSIEVRDTSSFSIAMTIGEATVIMNAFTPEGFPILDGGFAEAFDQSGTSLGRLPLQGGTAIAPFKADTQIYVRFTHSDYQSFQTLPQQLFPETEIVFDGSMQHSMLVFSPQIEFLGLFEGQLGEKADLIEPGHTYLARFTISIPETLAPQQAGMFVRAGTAGNGFDEPLLLGRVIASGLASEQRGITYMPPAGETTDFGNLSASGHKWITLSLLDPVPGDYSVGVDVIVSPEASAKEPLSLHYRSWAHDVDDTYLRDPVDTELGDAYSSPSKQGLYAASFENIFFANTQQSCEETFCYVTEWVIDNEENKQVIVPYELNVFGQYTLNFSISNNAGRDFDDSRLSLSTSGKGISFEGYSIRTPASSIVSEQGLQTQALEDIPLGEFRKGKTLIASVSLSPDELGRGDISIQLITENRSVFEKTINLDVIATQQLFLDVTPSFFPAYTEILPTVSLTEETGENRFVPVPQAIVNMVKTSPDGSEIRVTDQSNFLGDARFIILPSSPNTEIQFTAHKTGFTADPVTRVVSRDFISTMPERLESTLNTLTLSEETLSLTFENQTDRTLTLSELIIYGEFRGLLDRIPMNAFLQPFEGSTIGPQSTSQIQVQSILARNARRLLLRNENITGTLVARFDGTRIRETIDVLVPFAIEIKLGDLPDNGNCVIINKNEWDDFTEENNSELEFTIQNTCISEGVSISLDAIVADIVWQGQESAFIDLEITDPVSGQTFSEPLTQNRPTVIVENIEPNTTYPAKLTFTPKPGITGQLARFQVRVGGQLSTGAGIGIVSSTPTGITGNIDIVNLEQCITIPGVEEPFIASVSGTTSFEVDSSECGSVPVSIELCKGDDRCAGGAEGGITVEPQSFLLAPGRPRETIQVTTETIPGMYGITVHANLPRHEQKRVKLVDILVTPPNDNVFTLDAYDYFVIGPGAIDATTLTNTWLQETVSVRTGICAWSSAESKGDGIQGFINGAARAGVGEAALGAQGFPGEGAELQGLMYVATNTASFAGSAVAAGASFGGIAAAAGLGALIGLIFFLFFCLIQKTHPLPDFVINVKEDSLPIGMSNPGILAAWNLDEARIFGDLDYQTVGIQFTNTGLEEEFPVYSTATISATKHDHDQPTNYGYSSNFWAYDIKDSETSTFSRKFHLKFTTANPRPRTPDLGQTIKTARPEQVCTQGNLIGVTGKEFLPKIKLDWSWDEQTGIAYNQCDQANPDYVYCDATQFSIEMSKKLRRFENFLRANNYSFSCSDHPQDSALDQSNVETGSRTVPEGRVGVQSVTAQFPASTTAAIMVNVENKTLNDETIGVRVQVYPPTAGNEGDPIECVQGVNVAAGGTGSITCPFNELDDRDQQYVFRALIDQDSTTAITIDSESFIGTFILRENSTSGSCWIPRTTALIEDKPAFEYALTGGVTWTDEIPNLSAMRSLLKFNAFLMRDGYTQDFKQDFVEYYEDVSLFNAPAWFSDDPDGKISEYFSQNKINFVQEFTDTVQVPATGLYEVLVEIDVSSPEDWRLFDEFDGTPNADVKIVLNLLDVPDYDSVFYDLPLNGNVGLTSSNGRQGYGVQYENRDKELIIAKLANDVITTTPYPDASAQQLVQTQIIDDYKQLNLSRGKRGFLLKLQHHTDGLKKLVFSPTYATPVILKMSSEISPNQVSGFYTLQNGPEPVLPGETTSFWNGLGACRDFTGAPITQSFIDYSDRKATSVDPLNNWQNAYAVDWDHAVRGGDVYLHALYYTPQDLSMTVSARYPDALQFRNADSGFGTTAALTGVSGMKYNRDTFKITEIQQILELVEEETVCISSSINETSFFWNEAKILSAGNQPVGEFEDELGRGIACIR